MSKRTFVGFAISAVVAVSLSASAAAPPDLSTLINKTVVLENAMTRRDLLSVGAPLTQPAGTEGGWTSAPAVVGSDANYYNRTLWTIIPSGSGYIIQSNMTKRDLLSDGDPVTKSEGGWGKSPAIVGADSNYYNRGTWNISKSGEGYTIQNAVTKRYLFSTGEPITAARGAEGGWAKSPAVVGADANYYNRAIWKIAPP